MKKKVLFTLLLALFVIAGGWAQKKHDSYYGSNDRHRHYRSDECHSNGRGHGSHHGGKHKKHKKHKHKHHDHGDWDDYGHRQGNCNDHDRDDNWSNPGPPPRPWTRPGRPETARTGNTVKKTVYRPKAPVKAVKPAKRGQSRTVGSTAPARRTARPGN